MTLRLSTGLRNNLAQGRGFSSTFNRGSIEIYSGSQPLTADSAASGTLLGTVTVSSGVLTKETSATGTITITGFGGTINNITVGTVNIIPDGAVPSVTSINQTASDLCDAINRNGLVQATVSGAVVTVSPLAGCGAAWNAYVVTGSLTTATATYVNMSGGITPVNGLVFGPPVGGVVGKASSVVWSFNGAVSGTAGWFRMLQSNEPAAGAAGASTTFSRIDGSIATSGADMNLSNISIATGAPNTIDSFNFTIPAQ